MSNFKKGDKVIIKAGSKSIYGVEVRKDTPATVKFEADRDGVIYVLTDEPLKSGRTAHHDYGFKVTDFLPIDPEPAVAPWIWHWNDVEVGDTIEFRVIHTDETFTAVVTDGKDVKDSISSGRYAAGVWLGSTATDRRWTLLSVVKARPLPTDNGAVIKVVRNGSERIEHHLHLIDGAWYNGGGSKWKAEEIGLPSVTSWERVL